MKYGSVKIPLHGKGTALDKLNLHAEMASMNPNGFRTLSDKKNRKFLAKKDRTKKHPRGRFRTRMEKLTEEVNG